jgi:hypothetical protein
MTLFLCGFSFFLGVIFGLCAGRHGYWLGFNDGEKYGRSVGFRLAWLKQHRPLLNSRTEDFYDR